jgi:hypothetical protein
MMYYAFTAEKIPNCLGEERLTREPLLSSSVDADSSAMGAKNCECPTPRDHGVNPRRQPNFM